MGRHTRKLQIATAVALACLLLETVAPLLTKSRPVPSEAIGLLVFLGVLFFVQKASSRWIALVAFCGVLQNLVVYLICVRGPGFGSTSSNSAVLGGSGIIYTAALLLFFGYLALRQRGVARWVTLAALCGLAQRAAVVYLGRPTAWLFGKHLTVAYTASYLCNRGSFMLFLGFLLVRSIWRRGRDEAASSPGRGVA
ncbi:MAG TPA: hypothetical protein HPP83_12890 [Candidatus Hydrogenedentes bacterium]|nr:hypothetical protein [Candidatus Hydrogenedentota bacterium]